MKNLQRTALAIQELKAHMVECEPSSLVSSYFSQYLLVCLYSEMEEKVKDIVKTRVRIDSDQKLTAFYQSTIDGILKRVKKTDIADLARMFGDNVHEQFNNKFGEEGLVTNQEITQYSNAIGNRHLVAHSSGIAATFDEVVQAAEVGDRLLEALREVIA